MATIRQRFIAEAVLRIIDSGNGNVSNMRISEALNGVAELNQRYCDYHNSVVLGSRSEKLLMTAVRDAVLAHPRYSEPELVKAARVVIANLEYVWRKKHGHVMPVQEFRTDSNRADEVIARCYALLANCFNGRGNDA